MNGKADFGMIGLGVMGRNLLLNIADHGYTVVGYDKDQSKVEALRQEGGPNILAAQDLQSFLSQLRTPRAIMMLVPAGPPVDSVISEIAPLLEKSDILIDGGNSYFKDTEKRIKQLSENGIDFMGVGISGGEEGARHGPSIMPGGSEEAYERIRPILEAASAKVDGEPCVDYIGPDSAGHYVKMVHNGIEYGLMEIISETYDFMKRGLGLSDNELHVVYSQWNKTDLNGYLMEITETIFLKEDETTGNRLINEILDVAKQKGTGMWTTQSAMELQVPTPTIDMAVSMRDLSMLVNQRKQASIVLHHEVTPIQGDKQALIEQLRQAAYVSIIATFAQGMALLQTASQRYLYNLNLEVIARIWRGGCIIRAALLEKIREAFIKDKSLPNLLIDPAIAEIILEHEPAMRRIVSLAAETGIPIPGIMSALGYIDSLNSDWLPMNLIQAQRDFFGAHTYERKDSKGIFHTRWE